MSLHLLLRFHSPISLVSHSLTSVPSLVSSGQYASVIPRPRDTVGFYPFILRILTHFLYLTTLSSFPLFPTDFSPSCFSRISFTTSIDMRIRSIVPQTGSLKVASTPWEQAHHCQGRLKDASHCDRHPVPSRLSLAFGAFASRLRLPPSRRRPRLRVDILRLAYISPSFPLSTYTSLALLTRLFPLPKKRLVSPRTLSPLTVGWDSIRSQALSDRRASLLCSRQTGSKEWLAPVQPRLHPLPPLRARPCPPPPRRLTWPREAGPVPPSHPRRLPSPPGTSTISSPSPTGSRESTRSPTSGRSSSSSPGTATTSSWTWMTSATKP